MGRADATRVLIPGALALLAATLVIVGVAGAGSVAPAPLPESRASVEIVAHSGGRPLGSLRSPSTPSSHRCARTAT